MGSYTVQVQEDENGELVLDLPVLLLAEVGWNIGDTIIWSQHEDGTFKLTKADNDLQE